MSCPGSALRFQYLVSHSVAEALQFSCQAWAGVVTCGATQDHGTEEVPRGMLTFFRPGFSAMGWWRLADL
jgi:hypothetical protein